MAAHVQDSALQPPHPPLPRRSRETSCVACPASGRLGSQRVARAKAQPPHPRESKLEPEKVVRG